MLSGGSSEPRRRKKDPDRERSSPKSRDKDRERHKSRSSRPSGMRKTRSSASKEDDDDFGGPRIHERSSKERMRTASTSTPRSHKMAVVPEMERRGSTGTGPSNGSRTSLSYPSFSKTHSKENIYSREGPAGRSGSPYTPDATDVGGDSHEKEPATSPPPPTRAPPSPPLTATTAADLRKTASANSMRRKNAETIHKEMQGGRRSVDSGTRLTPEPRGVASRSSIRGGEADGTDLTSTTSSQPSTVRAKSPNVAPARVSSADSARVRQSGKAPSTTVRAASRQASDITHSTDSDATSVPPDHQPSRKNEASPTSSETSPDSVVDSSPRTPTQNSILPSVVAAEKQERPPTVEIVTDPVSRTQSVDSAYNDTPLTPPPPPPPPALVDPPRVDYLLQNGGLSRPVPRSLLASIDDGPVAAYNQYMSPRLAGPQTHDARAFFNPLQKLLDEYSAVMDTNGSLAVATGYRSVARRLLDRLEAVFARNISCEQCQCIMCLGQSIHEDQAGVNWGEILELVSGRCELPSWPPINQVPASGLGIADLEDPCQRIDVDVPEQYREHYAQQSRKTKVVVQSWLSNQEDTVPEDADDETLTFAMLTRLEQPQRPLFYAILYGLMEIPNPRSQPDKKVVPPYLTKAGLAVQRLYRLYSPPRNQLVVMYLMRNPEMHNTLATLSAVTKHEWEILVSGRFDGFLWSGAEINDLNSALPPSRGPSRNASGQIPPTDGPQRFASPFSPSPFTPFSPGPSPRPGSARPGSTRPGPAPVQIDEETEVAVLAEVEREIFLGMEAMEDAFEKLHVAAENVRRRLRERGAALSMVAQARRGPSTGGIEVRMDTPAGVRGDVDAEGLEDLRSEIGPDDSASNVSHNRKRRGHRTRQRRTPAPVEEESEVGSSLAERARRKY